MVFADDASKVQRIFDNLGLDAVKAQAGEATIASVPGAGKQAPAPPAPGKTETVKTEQGEVEFEVGGFEDDFNIGQPSRTPPKILLLAGRRNQIPRQWKRVRPSLPRPAKTLRPTQ